MQRTTMQALGWITLAAAVLSAVWLVLARVW